ncbi:resolvase domain protein [Candidatus Colimorpha enterica]|uniref:Resolvase domain protein n=1 Tax=Candidatus Colimorpha enterica TaxID=3083063 RepID=R6TMP9_9BACT|nr:resolvase domain protein [Candidatus Colimorpha enterica]
MEITAIRIGNLPLQGMKLFVSTASSRSRFESIIRQPVTPTALQPKPMHIVSACFPQAEQPAKPRSRLYAILGR